MTNPTPSLFFRLLEFVKFSHTVFAMPFALAAMVLAMATDWPLRHTVSPAPFWRVYLQPVLAIVGCMVFARTAAMGFNRVIDWGIDRNNPRTQRRHTLVTRRQAIALVIVSSLLFTLCTLFTNTLCIALGPVALILVFFYSVTKRFTHGSHFFLGLALAAAPLGAWAVVTGSLLDGTPFFLALAVLFWVAGFDIIYATQDYEFDRKSGLHSMPVRLGIPRALHLSGWLHLVMLLFLILFGLAAGFRNVYWGGLILIGFLVLYQHRKAARQDLLSINEAFFKANGLISLIILATVILEVSLRFWGK
ncbi:MAG: 4-hydroxybenzoate octaprenyltransferase [Verrucomicrobiae bacterium]|nr:4-hydroxybenzoate octaprenyltransferase [Verrucomicrobiae bacterium]